MIRWEIARRETAQHPDILRSPETGRRHGTAFPNIPLLFMGEEYGEEAPFLYFMSHSDPALIEAIRQGRRKGFAPFLAGGPPDPSE